MSDQKKIAKAAGLVGGATFLSRIFGFIRDMIIAQLFGAGMATDVFFVAFRIPNLFRVLVGEGSVSASFIPVYTEYINQRPKEEGDELVNVSFSAFFVLLLLITALGVIFSPWIVKIMAYGFSQDPEKLRLTIWLNRVMFPYIFLIGLVALAMGVLNSWKHFAAPALGPVLLNLCIIICALSLSKVFNTPVFSLAIGVLCGGAAQLLFQIPFMKKKGIVWRFRFNLGHPGVRRIGRLMVPSVLGLAVTQLNVLVSTLLASYLTEGSVSYLYYADRVLEFPMGIFAIAIATAVLPTLSEYAAKKDLQGLKDTLSFALRLVFFVTLPAMVGLIVLRQPILNVLFQRGAFNVHSAMMTAQALLYYSLGLVAFAGVRIIVPAFYSLQDTQTPVKVAFIALLVNAGLGSILMIPLRHGGLALATSVAAGVNFGLLFLLLKKKLGRIGARKIIRSFIKSLLASMVVGAVAYGICSLGLWHTTGVSGIKIILLLGAILSGVGVYGGMSHLLGSEEMRSLWEMIQNKIRRKSSIRLRGA
jgi:putative peptidoglycan lipid II flippase